MPKITRHGGPSNAGDILRALGKLGPYGPAAGGTEEPPAGPEPASEPAGLSWGVDPQAGDPWGSDPELEQDTDEQEQPASEPSAVEVDRAAVRSWAAENGVEVAARGKIPQAVVDQYLAATAGEEG